MFKTILWATDGSATADRALPLARALAERDAATIVAVHCRELLVGGPATGYPLLADDDEIVEKIRGQVDELKAAGIASRLEVISGRVPAAAHVIADLAREQSADVIVIGTRGHSPIAGLLVGSVTQRLLHIAHCPVLVIPGGKHAEEAERERETAATAG
jgi:nucleotide-binding universal stress UspA family protein